MNQPIGLIVHGRCIVSNVQVGRIMLYSFNVFGNCFGSISTLSSENGIWIVLRNIVEHFAILLELQSHSHKLKCESRSLPERRVPDRDLLILHNIAISHLLYQMAGRDSQTYGLGDNTCVEYAEQQHSSSHSAADQLSREAEFSNVKEFVARNSGRTVISSVAVKGISSMRQWAYETFGNERAIAFTVLATPEDLESNAEYIHMADRCVEVGAPVKYLLVQGHASEDPSLPERLADSPFDIMFIGPPASAMQSLGDKISSTIMAQSSGIPCIPWSGDGLNDIGISEDGIATVADHVYNKAHAHSADDGLEKARRIGFPVMIKASEGGGGKGIRKVESEQEFDNFYRAVASEVPGSPIMIMKHASRTRHIEVQILADQFGNTISLFGRDCSVQRRHQKIIEEAPATVVKLDTFRSMERAAISIAQTVGYVSAGTVEYLYSPDEDKFYFLELNPRLQVEHPTTEMVCGVNIPAIQLQIAMGLPLHRIKDIQNLYKIGQTCDAEIDFNVDERCGPRGHTIACRITAEDPEESFRPSTGLIQELKFRSRPDAWGYFSVYSGGKIHSFSDSQFGHIFAYGEDREAARQCMIVALKQLTIRSDFTTTIEYLIRLLETPEFKYNTFDTSWLDELLARKVKPDRPGSMIAVICGAVSQAHTERAQCLDSYRSNLANGRVLPIECLKTKFDVGFIYDGLFYKFTVESLAASSYILSLNESEVEVDVKTLSSDTLLVLCGGNSFHTSTQTAAGSTRVVIDGSTYTLEQEMDPSQLRAVSPGKLVRFTVDDGARVEKGQSFAEIEVMKMYMSLTAAADGRISIKKQPGSILEAGDLVATLQLDDKGIIKPTKPFLGRLPIFGSPQVIGATPSDRFTHLHGKLCNIMDGFDNKDNIETLLNEMIAILRSPELAYSDWNENFATLRARCPRKLNQSLATVIADAQECGGALPAQRLLHTIEEFVNRHVLQHERDSLRATLVPLETVLFRYQTGSQQHERAIIIGLLKQYYSVESVFSQEYTCDENIILKLLEASRDDIDSLVRLVLSHAGCRTKNNLAIAILEAYRPHTPGSGNVTRNFDVILTELSSLRSGPGLPVALKARAVLSEYSVCSSAEAYQHVARTLRISAEQSHISRKQPDPEGIADLVECGERLFDVLLKFLTEQDPWIVLAALNVYAFSAYGTDNLSDLRHNVTQGSSISLNWHFLDERRELVDNDVATTKSFHQTEGGNMPRKGAIAAVNSLQDAKQRLDDVLQSFTKLATLSDSPDSSAHAQIDKDTAGYVHVCTLAIRDAECSDDQDLLSRLTSIVDDCKKRLRSCRIGPLVFVCGSNDLSYPTYFTFHGPEYNEANELRHIEPAIATQLEISRMSNFTIAPVVTAYKDIHIFEATHRDNSADIRYFSRAVLPSVPGQTSKYIRDSLERHISSVINKVLNAMEAVSSKGPSDMNSIFFNLRSPVSITPEEVRQVLFGIIGHSEKILRALCITDIELRLSWCNEVTKILRFVATEICSHKANLDVYVERDSLLYSVDGFGKSVDGTNEVGKLHLSEVGKPYSAKSIIQFKQHKARSMGTQYVYDIPHLFRKAIYSSWNVQTLSHAGHKTPRPSKTECMQHVELVLDDKHEKLTELVREPGKNSIGMVSWIITARTPEYPQSRQFILIAHDLTFQSGSMGPEEEHFFLESSKLARHLGIPRIYISDNSGARITMAEELLPHFSVAWNDPQNPQAGFKYLYLTPEKHQKTDDAITEKIIEDGEVRYKITTIKGSEKGRGVQCLRGSGEIAGETSQAYEDIFTITLVTCRSVGIGAYLVRLGQRVIQLEGRPIVLTGAQAINHLLGRPVYTSNVQLGGTQIMCKNGITHLAALDDFDGVQKLLSWLSYIPDKKGNPVPTIHATDTWDRDITFVPPQKEDYDVRWLIEGKQEGNTHLTGLFDRDSFRETLGGWARSVVVGRARLGGIPIGIIAGQTHSVENIIPADPANPDSIEQVSREAGGVWFPNSAYKTAQALRDFNHGENLPLMILANWRGFSGGQNDMYNSILKFGFYIVDGLVSYRQPILIYIPPFADLRGGAWVIVDTALNPQCMETYADENSNGGVLEPEALVSIKYRKDKQLATMARLDKIYGDLRRSSQRSDLPPQEIDEIVAKMKAREKLLSPIYSQISLQFAHLQDTAARLEAIGVIRHPLRWANVRRFFYWRLRRRLAEEEVLKIMHNSSERISMVTRTKYLELLKEWSQLSDFDKSDKKAAEWYEHNRNEVIERIDASIKAKILSKVEALI
nr:acetyl-coa carboxylase [Quercus suber]